MLTTNNQFHIWPLGGELVDSVLNEWEGDEDLYIFILEEYEIGVEGDDEEVDFKLKTLSDRILQSGKKCYLFIGRDKSEIKHFTRFLNIPSAEVIYVPLYWLYKSCIDITSCEDRYTTEAEISGWEFNYQPTKTFCCYNHRSRWHRDFFLDNLQKYKLLDLNDFTYHDWDPEHRMDWEYWSPKKTFLEGDKYVISTPEENGTEFWQLNQAVFPPKYLESAIHLVTETTVEDRFYSEKTFFPILHEKPFLICGAYQQNQRLKDFGFKMYNFDYRFDSILDNKERIKALAKEVYRLSLVDPKQLYKDNREIARYNKQLALKFLETGEMLPEQLKKTYNF